MAVFLSDQSQQPIIFAHRHLDARSYPRHRTDRRNEAETNERTNNSPAVSAENVFARNQANLDSAAHFLHRCSHEEDGVEKDIHRYHNDSAGKKRARHIPLRLLYFADDVGRGIPARVRIHDINEGDREGAAENRHRVAGPRQYFPNAMAASAMGAAKPTVAETKPAMKPSAGW